MVFVINSKLFYFYLCCFIVINDFVLFQCNVNTTSKMFTKEKVKSTVKGFIIKLVFSKAKYKSLILNKKQLVISSSTKIFR